MLKSNSKIALAFSFFAATAAFQVVAESPVKIGQLDCTVTASEGGILSSDIVLACQYIDANGNNAGDYKGTIDRTGLDLGNMETEKLSWIVTTLGDPADAKIEGTYIGAAAGASVGAGAGGNYLTGGFSGKISLQPWSGETKSGFGISLSGQKLVLEEVSG